MKYQTNSDNYYFLKTITDTSERTFKIYSPIVETGKYIVEWKADREDKLDYVSVLIRFQSPAYSDESYDILNVYRNGRNYRAPSMIKKYYLPIDAIIDKVRR